MRRQLRHPPRFATPLESAVFPSRAFPLYWNSLAKLPEPLKEDFGEKHSFPLWAQGWHSNRRESERLALSAAEELSRAVARRQVPRERLLLLQALVNESPGKRLSIPWFAKYRFLFRGKACSLRAYALSGGETLAVLVSSDGTCVPGVSGKVALAAALEEAFLSVFSHLRYLERVRRGRLQLIPRLELQRLWVLFSDAGRAEKWLARLEGGRGPVSPIFRKHPCPWEALHDYHGERIARWASRHHAPGRIALGLGNCEPNVEELRTNVFRDTGWELIPVVGEVASADFFAMLARKAFPLSTNLRPLEQIFAASDPDLWHEVMGHLPFLYDSRASELYHLLGRLGVRFRSEEARADEIRKIYWYVAEYGVMRESGKRKLFGAGLLSSPLGVEKLELGTATVRPFTWENIQRAEGNPYEFQSSLFEVDSLEAFLPALRTRFRE